MNVLIIEDEVAASTQLISLLKTAQPEINVLAVLDSIREAVSWLHSNPEPDLIFSDIQLADGVSFEIFKTVGTNCPVIFATAYDEYMQDAFKLHSIDYLLKPINERELKAALDKFENLRRHYNDSLYEKLSKMLQAITPVRNYKTRFLLKTGDRLSTLGMDQVAYICAENRYVFVYDKQGKKSLIEEPLDGLEKTLNPHDFFRLNRRYISPLESIEKIETHFNGKLHIRLKHCPDNEIFVSREKGGLFKAWLQGGLS